MQFLVSERYKFLLGWSAKCGCSSIKKWFLHLHEIEEPADGNIHKFIGYGNTAYSRVEWSSPDRYADYKKFLIVRNPYKRLISGFVNKYVGNHYENDGWDSFEEFISVLSDDANFDRINKHHFTPQFSEDYPRFARHFTFDAVFKLEELQRGLDSISRATHAPEQGVESINTSSHDSEITSGEHVSRWSIDKLKSHKKNLPSPDRFYTYDLIKVVERVYQTDFENLRALGVKYPRPRIPTLERFRGSLNDFLDSGRGQA